MKRGYTKPFSKGRLGEEQRRDKAKLESIRYHASQGNHEMVKKLSPSKPWS